MVLFYTDLMAKLWGWEFMETGPSFSIEGFVPETRLPVASIYLDEMERLNYTRLWFGKEDRGFQVAERGNSIIMSRGATRIYAASSNSLRPGEEAPANAQSEAFLGWWNDHYLEVARFEPEYERLNEVMKWSLVIGWLNQKDRGSLLGFLADYSVNRSRWFPNWVKHRPELKFQHWDRIGFYPHGYKEANTEALPLQYSSVYYRDKVRICSLAACRSRRKRCSRRARPSPRTSPPWCEGPIWSTTMSVWAAVRSRRFRR